MICLVVLKTRRSRRAALALAALAIGGLSPLHAKAADALTFEDNVRRVFREHCVSCHNTNRPRAGLDLSTFESAIMGGDSGEVLVAGDPEDSFLYLVTAHEEEPIMPPGGERIPDEDLEVLRNWIAQGMPDTIADVAMVEQEQPVEARVDEARSADPPVAEATAISAVYRGEFGTPVVAMAASDVTGLIAVGGQLQVLIYSIESGELVRVLPFPEGEPQSLRFSSDGERLIAGGGVHAESGRIVVWQAESGKRLWQGGEEYDVVLATDLSPDGRRVVLGGPERLVKVISTETNAAVLRLEKHTDWVLTARFSPDGLLFATADRDGGVYVWETESGALLHSLRGHKGPVPGLCWLPGGDACATCGEDGSIRCWDMHTGELLRSWMAHKGGVVSVEPTAEGLVSTGRDGAIRRWSARGESMADPVEHAGLPTSLAIVDGRRAVVGDYDGGVTVIEDGETLTIGPPTELITADISRLASAPPVDQTVSFRKEPMRAVRPARKPGMVDDRLVEQAASLEQRLLIARDRLPELLSRAEALRSELTSSGAEGGRREEANREVMRLESLVMQATEQSEQRNGRRERLSQAETSLRKSLEALEFKSPSSPSPEQSEAIVLVRVALERLTESREQIDAAIAEAAAETASLQGKLAEARAALQRSRSSGADALRTQLESLEEELVSLGVASE